MGRTRSRVFPEIRTRAVCRASRRMRREGSDIARCTVARLMQERGAQGIIQGKPHRTTIPDKAAPCLPDRVNRPFRVPAPDMLRISDFTRVATWQGFVHGAFVVDAYVRRIVGWRVSRSANAGFGLDDLEPIGNVPAADAEAAHHAALATHDVAAWP